MSSSRNTLLFILICGISCRMTSSKTNELEQLLDLLLHPLHEEYNFECDTHNTTLACNESFECVILIYDWKHIRTILDLDALIEICNNGSTTIGNVSSVHPLARMQNVVILKLPPLPPNNSCKLTIMIRNQYYSRYINPSKQLGFNTDFKNQFQNDCCACIVKEVRINFHKLQVVSNASLCGFSKLETLDMSLGQIAEIDSNAFLMLTALQRLYIANNQLKQLSHNVFRPLTGLVHLSLIRNQLNEDVFQALQNMTLLKVLDLSSNLIADLDNDTIGNGLTSLIELQLKYNKLTSLRADFSHLQKLETINFSGNEIRRIAKGVFDPLQQLRRIDLSGNRLISLSDDLFIKNVHLKWLYLKDNQLISVPNLMSTSLEKLILNGNKIGNITASDKDHLSQLVNLKYLDLSNNLIEAIVVHAFECNGAQKNQPKLTHIGLSLFAKTVSCDRYAIAPNLQLLNLMGNNLEVICPFYFPNITLLVESNPLQCACERHFFVNQKLANVLSCPKALESRSSNSTVHLIKEWDTIHQFSCYDYLTDPGCQCNLHSSYSTICNLPCPESCTCYVDSNFNKYLMNCSGRNLHVVQQLAIPVMLLLVLHYSSNHLTTINSSTFASYSLLIEVNVKNNELKEISYNAFHNLTNLQVLNLEENCLKELPAVVFHGLTKLNTLNLAKNKLVRIPNNIFQNLTNLQVLNLEDNSLKELPLGLFAGLTKLTWLYMAQNHLMYIPDDIFQSLMVLQILDLQNNSLTYLSAWNLEKLMKISHLKLGHNSWSCDCTFVLGFQEWLKARRYLVQDGSDVFCKSEDDTVPPHPILSANFSYCYSASPGFIHVVASVTHIWTSVMAAFVLLIISLILLFVYRCEMQVIIYSRYRLRIFHRNQETDEGKVYDAFLAYSYDDAEFIVHELIPGLEQIERPYKLCIHERDFLAGGPIMYNILEAVEQSRRTIVVLSPNFVKSEWCVFEFKSAHLKMLLDRCSRIIVILLGDIPKDIDREILVYLKTNTYLKWGDKLFWKRLYFALPDRTVAETTI